MPRNFKRKTEKGTYSQDAMERSLNDVIAGKSIRSAAKENGLNYNTVNRKFKKLNGAKEIPAGMSLTSNYAQNCVFPPDIDEELAGYVRDRSDLSFGLDTHEVRSLAYDLGITNNLKVPKNWHDFKLAGKDWFISFMKRHSTLYLRTPQQCSISRATAFNKHTISKYFEKLAPVLKRNPLFESGDRVFDADEVGTTTVGAVSRKVIAPKGIRQVHQVRTHERGETVTTLCFVCAKGTFLPPVILYPRKNTNTGFMKDAYPDTLPLASGKKGYMNDEMMEHPMKHLIKQSGSSKDNPSLLIVDNFGSHITLNVINLCKDNGVTLITLPPHTTHRTQRLDVALFSPFKKVYDHAVHIWSARNPGKSSSIYEVAGFVNAAICQAFTPQNIASSFRASGICPVNPNIFPDSDFVKSSVTFQPEPAENTAEATNVEPVEDAADPASFPESVDQRTPSVASTSASAKAGQDHVSPQDILPLPKALPNQPKRKGRKKGRCMVATDTPEKQAIEQEVLEKQKKNEEKIQRAAIRKKKKKEAEKRRAPTPKTSRIGKRQKKTARELVFEDSSSEEDSVSVSSKSSAECHEDDNNPPDPNSFPDLPRDPEEGEYVLVEFAGKETHRQLHRQNFE